ncbi:hypothetical protein WN944_026465 [Citrus x changshan-huyou]|uniref:Uncharacterized protein n=1 Tax=Citrus x changshan-huyou TaxID=2935761 RepID=A0AAP0LSF7_9ROSI
MIIITIYMTRLRCQVFREAWKVCLAPANSIYRDIIHNMNEYCDRPRNRVMVNPFWQNYFNSEWVLIPVLAA